MQISLMLDPIAACLPFISLLGYAITFVYPLSRALSLGDRAVTQLPFTACLPEKYQLHGDQFPTAFARSVVIGH